MLTVSGTGAARKTKNLADPKVTKVAKVTPESYIEKLDTKVGHESYMRKLDESYF